MQTQIQTKTKLLEISKSKSQSPISQPPLSSYPSFSLSQTYHIMSQPITLHYITSHTPELPIIFSFRLHTHTHNIYERTKEGRKEGSKCPSPSNLSVHPSTNHSTNPSINGSKKETRSEIDFECEI